ncbi:hypothetical protein THRCLA_22578 [Thraustotheca clavata]|uniref:Uncharacterized protein n=1 Tax=Thraustotheca clavata TaxID=74557 RepID=A0A1V9YWT6_9STRA|nr:hypothetical protein THRCLA_22578 [Thraustotheca clavata]
MRQSIRVLTNSRGLRLKRMVLMRFGMLASFLLSLWRQFTPPHSDGTTKRLQFDNVIYLSQFIFIMRECIRPCIDLPSPQLTMLYAFTIASFVLNTIYVEACTGSSLILASVAMDLLWLVGFATYVLVIENVEPPHIFATISIHKDCAYPCRSTADYLCIRVPFTLSASWLGAKTIASLSIALTIIGVSLDMYIYISCFSALLMANIIALLWQGDLVFASVGAWTFVWLEIKSAQEKILVVENSDEFAAICAIQAMATLGLSVLVSVTTVLLVVRYCVKFVASI